MPLPPLQIAQRYFDAWNQHDANAVVATFAEGGTYADTATPAPLTGPAIGAYAQALWTAFPDLSFEIVSIAQNDSGLVSAEWLMKGTNTASFNGLPPTGIAFELLGADFIRVEADGIRSVQGYFDAAALPRKLGLDVIIQPKSIGPFSFGNCIRASNGSTAIPGAFSITSIEARSPEEREKIRESSRKIATELLSMPGFISFVGTTVGDRLMTVTAWETPDSMAALMTSGEHRLAIGRFFGQELGRGGATGIWVSDRLNPRRIRCTQCSAMTAVDPAQANCACGASLPAPLAYW
jgi:steroid delta-isomerase-like uncharacterized protein